MEAVGSLLQIVYAYHMTSKVSETQSSFFISSPSTYDMGCLQSEDTPFKIAACINTSAPQGKYLRQWGQLTCASTLW